MPRLSFSFENSALFEKMLQQSDAKIREATAAGAEMLCTYVGNYADRMLSGPYSTGITSQSVITKQVSYHEAVVTYEGTRANNWNPPPLSQSHDFSSMTKRNGKNRKRKKSGGKTKRTGEVAFVNEYGARGRAARPFNRTALSENEDGIIQRMSETIFD